MATTGATAAPVTVKKLVEAFSSPPTHKPGEPILATEPKEEELKEELKQETLTQDNTLAPSPPPRPSTPPRVAAHSSQINPVKKEVKEEGKEEEEEEEEIEDLTEEIQDLNEDTLRVQRAIEENRRIAQEVQEAEADIKEVSPPAPSPRRFSLANLKAMGSSFLNLSYNLIRTPWSWLTVGTPTVTALAYNYSEVGRSVLPTMLEPLLDSPYAQGAVLTGSTVLTAYSAYSLHKTYRAQSAPEDTSPTEAIVKKPWILAKK